MSSCSSVTLPSDKVLAALKAAVNDNQADLAKLIEPFKTVREWSWRKLKFVERTLGHYDRIREAEKRNYWDYSSYNQRQCAISAAWNALAPICQVADQVTVSTDHYAAISYFYQR
jgi:hypothetical protein